MHPERVERISNIKATAWTTVILFSLAGYLIFSNYLLGALLLRDGNTAASYEAGMFQYLDRVLLISMVVVLYMVLVVYGAMGLLKLRLNGLIVFHATTILLIVLIIAFVIYNTVSLASLTTSDNKTVRNTNHFQLFQVISYQTVLLVFAWVLVKVNLMLMRKEYRNEFS